MMPCLATAIHTTAIVGAYLGDHLLFFHVPTRGIKENNATSLLQ